MRKLKLAVAAAAVLSLAACSYSGPGALPALMGNGSSSPAASSSPSTSSSPTTVAAVVTTKPSTKPKPKPASTSGGWGSTHEIHDSGAVGKITVSAPKPLKPGEFDTVKGKLYGVTVTVTGVSGSLQVDPLFFAARDKAGDSLNLDIAYDNNNLPTATVTAGQKLRGVLAYDVPKGQRIDTVILSTVFGSQLAVWS